MHCRMTIRIDTFALFRFLLTGLLVLSVIETAQAQRTSPVTHTFFLVGDAGEGYVSGETFGSVLRDHISRTGPATTVLFLGDNIYPAGLPETGSRSRQSSEKILRTQADWVQGSGAKGIFIPGNHDWQHWGKNGLEYITRQQQWIDSLKDERISFLPQSGCPGPIETLLTDKLALVIVDTQWFLHQYEKPGEEGPCEAKTTADVFALLADIFQRHHDKRIIVAGHHPIITYGEHGGVFTLKDHLFPFTAGNPNLYIPMPLIGSLYPMYRKLFGHIQDTAHPTYKEFSEPMHQLLKAYPGSIYVAGHEHALEYSVKDSTHYIVSGSGAKVSAVKKKKYARLAEDKRGFAQLSIHEDGNVSLLFFEIPKGAKQSREIYSVIIPPSPGIISDTLPSNG
jgi:UDP-2,3-diacylglucosamine pyrophosphatase LpxH